MFDRVGIKDYAKNRLRGNHFLVVLIVFLTGLLGGATGGSGSGGGIELNFEESDSGIQINLSGEALGEWVMLFLPLLITAVVAGLLLTILVSNVMTVGAHGWLLRYWRGETPSVGELFAAFRFYKPAVITMLVRELYTFLWSLLFIIPGIVKAYAYSMTPYILYENPNLTADQAISLSCRMTDGVKGDLFVLDLSWLGWSLLSAMTLGIVGVLYVNPYRGVTHAGVYDQLKWNAIQSGRLTWEDFGQLPPAAAPYEEPTI